MIEVLKGLHTATQAKKPEVSSMVDGWIIHAKGISPAWEHYFLCIGHLRDYPGWTKADKRFPQATHELRLDAMDSARNPVADDHKSWCFLSPPNVVWQFVCASDDEAGVICRALVREAIDFGNAHYALSVCLETEGIRVNNMTAKEYWRERLKLLLPPGTRIE